MVDASLLEKIKATCQEIASTCHIVSACLYGSRVCGYARPESDYDVLLVLENYFEGLRYHFRKVDAAYVTILAVDKELFELDAKKGGLGEFLADRLLFPYVPILSPDYLIRVEQEIKSRVIGEELRDLVVEYGELSRGLIIKPEYLALARMRKRARVYPPIRYSYVNTLREDLKQQNLPKILEGYNLALHDFIESGMVKIDDGNIMLQNNYIDKLLSKKTMEKAVNVVELSRKALYSILSINVETVARELSLMLKRELQMALTVQEPEDPKNHLFLKTDRGLVNLNEKASMVEVASKLRPGATITIAPLAGVLNEVCLVTAGEEKLVAKKFTDWHGFKWFTLSLVTLGTKFFAIAGKTRLANEYGMNRFLAESNVPVPSVVHVSLPNLLLFERYVDGRPVTDFVRESFGVNSLTPNQKQIALEVGKTLAKIHGLDVGMGDTKPENFVLSSDGEVYAVDLEQAKKRGDRAWDVAEFLFYAGHYGVAMTGGFLQFAQNFVEGYREVGDSEVLRKAGGLPYARVFSIWTPATVIYGLSEILKTA